MRWPDGRYIQASIFFSRWLLAPFLLGLLLCLLLLLYRFFADLVVLTIQLPQMNWHDLVTNVLNLVDLALTANLILIVIFSSYENFIRRIDAAEHPDWPVGLTQVDFAEDYHQQYLAKNPHGYCGLGGTGVSCTIGTGVAA